MFCNVGATSYDYVVTVLDVDAVLGVECIPVDDNDLEVRCMHKT
jgi:hypothetical protein